MANGHFDMKDSTAGDYDIPAGQEICKDFVRNVCNRGNKCKFFHPPNDGAESRPKPQEFEFCHDYQNRGCRRENCRFVHCSREDEEAFKRFGRVSDCLARAILISGQGSAENINGVPICKDFLVGKCDRGRRCRYWHIDPEADSHGIMRDRCEVGRMYDDYSRAGCLSPYYSRAGMFGYGGGPPGKRCRPDEPDLVGMASVEFSRGPSPSSYVALSDENSSLRHQVEMLKKQVADLTAANEVLLEQNARLRTSKHLGAIQAAPTDVSIAASIAAAATNLLTSTAPTAQQAVSQAAQLGPDTLAAVAVSLAQQSMVARQNLGLTAATCAPPHLPLVSYPTTYARADTSKLCFRDNKCCILLLVFDLGTYYMAGGR